MTPTRRILFLSAAGFFLLAFQGCAPAPWLRANQVRGDIPGVLVWVEPGVPVSRLQPVLKEVVAFHRSLEAQLAQDSTRTPLRLAIYASRESYAALRPVPVDSMAHFHRESQTIHIPITAPLETWRHETVHAFLYEHNPDLPYWLQEGTAYLLQGANERPLCHGQPLRLPAEILPYRSLLLAERRPLPLGPLSESDNREQVLETTRAAYFAFFLWQRGELLSVIHHQVSDPATGPWLLLTGGDLHRHAALSADFYEWLGSPAAVAALPGC